MVNALGGLNSVLRYCIKRVKNSVWRTEWEAKVWKEGSGPSRPPESIVETKRITISV